MPATPAIVAFAGSLRRGSWNKKLVRLGAETAREAGAEVTLLDLADYRVPVFDEDLERSEGMPENALRLRREMERSDGLLLSSPEYNSSIPGILKNVIDWISRPIADEPPQMAFRGKVVALLSASPGALGGLRGLIAVRAILGHLGCIVLPDQMALPQADRAFSADEKLADPKRQEQMARVVRAHVAFLQRLT